MRTTISTVAALPLFLAVTLCLGACRGEVPAADPASTEASAAPALESATTASAGVGNGQAGALSRTGWADLDQEPLYQPWARVLEAYVDEEGLVDYAGLAGPGRADLDSFMQALAGADPAAWSESRQIAFWINAYNATTVYQIVERYPLDSVRDVGSLFGLVGGFFKQPYPIANDDRTLDNIEHDTLRADFADARIHWTLVCGAFGCPRLIRRPYVAADLDALLTELSFEFMANPRALQIDDAGKTLHVSSYFDWYGGDFEAEAGDIVDYILRYAPDDKATWIRANRDELRVRFMDYDWTLNDQAKGPRSQRPVRP